MSRGRKLAVIVFLQIVFLVGIGVFKIFTLYTGTPVLLKTVPVDPWDLFRGEYISLRYDISEIRQEDVNDRMQQVKIRAAGNQKVYVTLEKEGRYWRAASIGSDKPLQAAGQVVIRGDLLYFDQTQKTYHVKYGLESYYVEEGTAERIGNSGSVDVQVRVDRFGNAVIEKLVKA